MMDLIYNGSVKEKINYRRNLMFLKKLIHPYRFVFLKLLFLFTLATFLRSSSPLIVKHIIDFALRLSTPHYVILGAVIFLFINITFFIINYYALFILMKTGQRIVYEIKNKAYSYVSNFDMDYFSQNNPGKIAARIQNDANSVYEIFSEFSITIFIDAITLLIIFLIMYYHNNELTIVIFPFILLILVFIAVFVKKSQNVFVEVRKKIAELTSYVSEMIGLMSIIRIHGAQKSIEDRFEKVNFEKFLKTLMMEYIAIFLFLTIMLFDPVSKATIFGYGGIKVLNHEMTVGSVVMFVLYIGQLFEPLFRFSDYVSVIQRSFASLERINRIFDIKPQISSGSRFIDRFDFIEFKDVWMKYPQSDWVLRGLSFRLERGKTLAVVGRTGEGKSTIANIIFRFYDYQKGSISVNGQELRDININSLRKKIGFVQQDIYLFPTTLRDNLRFMDEEIDDSKIMYAIKMLELEDFYKKYSLDMEIKEKGANLSAGEKQIISLTRTLILDQELIILDEATSNVDPYTETIITNAIRKIMKQKTLIIIAHRLSTIVNADFIGFLKDGRFVEFGNHNELLSLRKEYYSYFRLNY